MMWLKASRPLNLTEDKEEDTGYPKPIEIVGYTGEAMPGWFEPIVIDLEGIEFSDRIPILLEHKRENLVGMVRETKVADTLTLRGEIFDTPAGQTVVNGKDVEYQASVGIIPDVITQYSDEQSVEVNGRTFEGPVTVIEECRLEEISCVLWGRDSSTSVKCSLPQPRRTPVEEEVKEVAVPPPTPSQASLEELQKEFTDPAFILECFNEKRTMIQAKEAFLAREFDRLKNERQALEAAQAAAAAQSEPEPEGADPVPVDTGYAAPPISITFASVSHVPCTEPFETEDDRRCFAQYAHIEQALHGKLPEPYAPGQSWLGKGV